MRKVYGDNAPQAGKTGGQNGDGDERLEQAYGLFLKGESDLVLPVAHHLSGVSHY